MLLSSKSSTSLIRQIECAPSQSRQKVERSQDSCSISQSLPTDSVSDGLCVECRQVDWHAVARQVAMSNEKEGTRDGIRRAMGSIEIPRGGIKVGVGSYDFPSLQHWSDTVHGETSNCPICIWVITTMKHWRYGNDSFRMKIFDHFAFQAAPEDDWRGPVWISQDFRPGHYSHSDGDSTDIGITNPRVIVATDTIVPRIIGSRAINYDVLRGWLEECVSRHPKHCLPSKIDPAFKMKVFHCRTREIVSLKGDTPYVALSYLWGRCLEQPSDGAVLPQTIEDALTVSLMLGFEYIWIDRYCIDQNNQKEQHDQIRNMDSIYSGAGLVIIACAGDDPSYGLPGVSVRPRHPQRRIKMGDWTLIELRARPQTLITQSAWAKRAWTYQEGYLAKRRLIFTDYEVMYICDQVTCRETLSASFHHRELGFKQHMDDLFAYSAHQEHSTSLPHIEGYSRTEIENYQECIEGYSHRQLSYESDTIDACSGVLSFLSNRREEENENLPLLFFWGLRVFECGLDLAWYHTAPGFRRPGFPTWTWAGSTGPMFHARHFWEYMRDIDGLEVGVRRDAEENGSRANLDRTPAYTWQAMEDYYAGRLASAAEAQKPPPLLKLTGKCPRFRLAHTSSPSPESGEKIVFWFALAKSSTQSLIAPLLLDIEMTEADLGDCFLLLVGKDFPTTGKEAWLVTPLFLVVKPVAGGCFERVGIVALSHAPPPEACCRDETWELPLFVERTVILE